jgi:cob(I)alamin adenosyltransferase
MVKIYTKTGDRGETSLANGKRVSKSALRICACGNIDELNAVLGVCRHSADETPFVAKILRALQKDLFVVGADVAMPVGVKGKTVRVSLKDVERLEGWIDAIEETLPELKNFIVPGGCELAAFLHLARTACRRAERSVVDLRETEKKSTSDFVLMYLNRLSDLLFVMARYVNAAKKIDDKSEIWSN